MTRRVPVQEIRGSDATFLEVQLSELLRRPLGQVAPVNVMDLIELATTEGRPRSLQRGLDTFVDGVARQIADIPNGRPFVEYLEELQEIEPTRIPTQFREMLAAEAEREGRTDGSRIYELLERWAGIEPEPFELGLRKARVERPRPRAPKVSSEPSSAPRERRRSRGPGRSARPVQKARETLSDPERERFIRDLALEKLARASENGLQETILIAGIRHMGREQFPDMLPNEITSVLKSLREAQQVRYSAGRWSLPTRF